MILDNNISTLTLRKKKNENTPIKSKIQIKPKRPKLHLKLTTAHSVEIYLYYTYYANFFKLKIWINYDIVFRTLFRLIVVP